MKKAIRILTLVLALCVIIGCTALPAFAADNEETAAEGEVVVQQAESDGTSAKAIAAAITIAIAAGAGAIAMGLAVAKASESTARQPEAGGDIRSTMMLGLVFIETAIIYALIVAVLVIFVM